MKCLLWSEAQMEVHWSEVASDMGTTLRLYRTKLTDLPESDCSESLNEHSVGLRSRVLCEPIATDSFGYDQSLHATSHK